MLLAITLFFLNLGRHVCLAFLIAVSSAAVLLHRALASTRIVHDSSAAQERNKRNTLYLLNPLVLELNAQWVLLKTSIYMRAEQGGPLNCITIT
jgi:hypothetical protein